MLGARYIPVPHISIDHTAVFFVTYQEHEYSEGAQWPVGRKSTGNRDPEI